MNYFIKRGEKTEKIEFGDEKLAITFRSPTNREHNELMEKYTNFGIEGVTNVEISAMAEAQILTYLIELPFEVPINHEMTEFKMWSNCSDGERKIAINQIDPKIYDAISNIISGTGTLTSEESGN